MDDNQPVTTDETLVEGARTAGSARTDRRIQSLRGKGEKTRASIIAETLKMVAERPLPEVTMANVSKELGLNKTAFYRYFGDIGEVLVEALAAVTQEAEALLPLLDEDWSVSGVHECALRFVDSYLDIWTRHAALIRARNSLAEAGDARFMACRREAATALTGALAKKLAPLASPERALAPPFTMSSLLIMAVERASTVTAHGLYSNLQSWDDLRLGLAEMIEAAISRRAQASATEGDLPAA